MGVLAARLKDTRRVAKKWSKHKHTPLLINNCKFIIRLLDLLEEHRRLCSGEATLRSLCREKLLQLLKARAAYWKQRGKFRVVKEGNENTRFHHAHASQRLRKNHIKALEVQGVRFTSHVDKEQILSNHFTSLLGSPAATSWDFDVHGIYRDLPRVDSLPLITPFTVSEARAAIRAMNPISAPGPDGFAQGSIAQPGI